MSRIIGISIVLLVLSVRASADVFLWSGNASNVTITGDNVRIDAAGTFKFEALTTPMGSVLAAVGNVTVNSGVTGNVTVYIERSTDNDMPGATNVGAVNLTNNMGASLTGNLAELRITGRGGTVPYESGQGVPLLCEQWHWPASREICSIQSNVSPARR